MKLKFDLVATLTVQDVDGGESSGEVKASFELDEHIISSGEAARSWCTEIVDSVSAAVANILHGGIDLALESDEPDEG